MNQLTKAATLLLAVFFLQSCSSVKTLPKKERHNNITKKIKSSLPPKFENFDRKPYPNEAFVIANMISVVQPELDEEERDTIASQISLAIKKYKIEPQIIVAIIDTESDFRADKISITGDLSVAQINVEVWNKEFIRMRKLPMIKEKIKMDQEYALMKMAEILNIIKKRYAKKDRRWYARYHSNTHRYKNEYLHKLEIRLKMLATSADLNTQIAQTN
ncbi:MAG: transglycosylase SLT domain-containing protein [Bacteriovorax sp.]|nr:transglycosylase SLT domain-containing protein [Bacteriovorax sp.]